MKGSSGSDLTLKGDWILKNCSDSQSQVAWFVEAEGKRVARDIYLPLVREIDSSSYEIEKVSGVLGTGVNSFSLILKLYDQIKIWSEYPCERGDILSYIVRMREQHIFQHSPPEVLEVMEFLEKYMPSSHFPGTFCHGDLTLENILVRQDGKVALIDPNNKGNLFRSYILDLGKILQSIHSDYHRMFDSNPGVDQTWMWENFRALLERDGLLKPALLAEISHLLRLRKYRPKGQRILVDHLMQVRIEEYQRLLND